MKNDDQVIELVSDPNFRSGFHVLGISSVQDRKVICKLDYNKSAELTKVKLWYMAQWWTPYTLAESIYSYQNGCHIYKTPSRTIAVNPDVGLLHIDLSGSDEYFGKPRKHLSDSWPHALIEQTFQKSAKMTDLSALKVHLEVSIDSCVDKNGSKFDPSLHAAQLLWYFTLQNKTSGNEGTGSDYLWFGVPIFDSRFDYLKQSAFIDTGSPGTSNKLIYSMDSRVYLTGKIVFGKKYSIDVDILPFVKEAFAYAISHNALIGCKLENMEIGYMNFGWELPGMYDVSSTISGISVKAYYK